MIGPSALISYQITETTQQGAFTCIKKVDVTFTLDAQPLYKWTFDSEFKYPAHIDFKYGGGSFIINGTGNIWLDDGCSADSSGIPQLLVDYKGVNGEIIGGYNGSIIFDSNKPSNNTVFMIANSAEFRWTACIEEEGGLSVLKNATIWIMIEGIFSYARYFDLFDPTGENILTSLVGGVSINTSLYYESTDITEISTVCEDMNCWSSQMQVFSVADCPANV
eukprot:TRINITY_DN86_c0_g1_i1.p1 TRINITY_DN86_c0_g1~~TRINITY_DN86_c0_g1_i1.p1  ORF type:complete len:221 (-),score=52.00 TRINITY_DN86_c0_g1_i1:33-695(-)